MALKIPDNKKLWITSDTHYGHTNICRGVTNWRTSDGQVPIANTRAFLTLEEMNDTIVNNINSVVGKDDVLIHLGDFSFGGFENIENFRSRINCNEIHLVFGNHDHHIEKNKNDIQKLFTSCQWFLQFTYFKKDIECLHFPIVSWNGLNKGRIHVHGHTHLPNDKKVFGRRIDVGMDGHPEFRPYNVKEEIIDVLLREPIKSQLWELDHHLDEFN